MEENYRIGKFVDNCCEIQLPIRDLEVLKIDNVNILLELHPSNDEYVVYYSAKGREWDIWCRADEVDYSGGVASAIQDPLNAARQLLLREWRADFEFDPNEDS